MQGVTEVGAHTEEPGMGKRGWSKSRAQRSREARSSEPGWKVQFGAAEAGAGN